MRKADSTPLSQHTLVSVACPSRAMLGYVMGLDPRSARTLATSASAKVGHPHSLRPCFCYWGVVF